MRLVRGGHAFAWLMIGVLVSIVRTPDAAAQESDCRLFRFAMTPTDDLQIVIWIEDEAGNYVDTAYITRLTGTYGLGNRPGIMEFNSAREWPYGRRTTTFPVWSGKHGMDWPLVLFQGSDAINDTVDRNLSHPLTQSSVEPFYCRPIREDETLWDMTTCATTVYTDKGVLSDRLRSSYPPRADLNLVENVDHETVADMESLNPFDLVSRATPPGDQRYDYTWVLPDGLPDGNYVAMIEVNKEFDQNASYSYAEPEGIPWQEYGEAYRGQPSVLYRMAFTLDDNVTTVSTLDYVGYGDPDGIDHDIRVPDATITNTPGSGAGRLLVTVDGTEMYRVRLETQKAFDRLDPGAVGQLELDAVSTTTMTASFIAPGDDDQDGGTVTGYEIRYLAGTPITADNFSDALPAAIQVTPLDPGTVHEFTLDDLLPNTNYYIGVRAYDECYNQGELEVLHVVTPLPEPGAVDACFVATAAYGSLMANDVALLRQFRDVALRSHVTGELLVEGYYTFGPLFARIIEPSETLRRAARSALTPAVDLARSTLGAR